MENEVIKKLKIPYVDLPAINSENQGYSLRYRIVSSDRNRTSHWSPIYLIVPDFDYVSGNIYFSKSGNIAQLAWDSVEVKKLYESVSYSIAKALQYDIWVRWDRGGGNGDWLYKERLQTTSISLPIPSTWTINGVVQGTSPNRLSVEIYLKGYPIERSDGPAGTPFLKVYRLLNETV
jgi:hypothetical protein